MSNANIIVNLCPHVHFSAQNCNLIAIYVRLKSPQYTINFQFYF